MNHVPKEEAIKGAFFGALVGDALCLGSHYEYDAAKILKAYGNRPIDRNGTKIAVSPFVATASDASTSMLALPAGGRAN